MFLQVVPALLQQSYCLWKIHVPLFDQCNTDLHMWKVGLEPLPACRPIVWQCLLYDLHSLPGPPALCPPIHAVPERGLHQTVESQGGTIEMALYQGKPAQFSHRLLQFEPVCHDRLKDRTELASAAGKNISANGIRIEE